MTSFMQLWLPWKPIKNYVTTLNYVPNFMSIRCIVSKVDGGGVRVTLFCLKLLGLNLLAANDRSDLMRRARM